jgi:ABC-type multidrug transport system fused ATPase/permease subunit
VNSFWRFGYHFPLAIGRLAGVGTLLFRLLGLRAIISGFNSCILVLPLNKWLSNKYNKFYFELMRHHDSRTRVLEKVLHGLRQIRFSRTEDIWERKILSTRTNELDLIKTGGKYISLLVLASNLGPVLLTAVSLSTFALFGDGKFVPSVAFTALSLFDQLYDTLSLLPLYFSYVMEAWASCTRIDDYLHLLDQEPIVTTSELISFNNATIRWPEIQGQENGVARFVLRNVTVQFPPEQLTIVTGESGSGKSLL